MSDPLIPQLFQQQAERFPNRTGYAVKEQGVWKTTTWREYAAQVRSTARALIALGLEPGQTAGILGGNRPEWVLFDLACQSIACAPVGLYTLCSNGQMQYILHHAESRLILIDNADAWQRLEPLLDQLPALAHVVTMDEIVGLDDPRVLSWSAFLALGETVPESRFEERLGALRGEDLAMLIYTSGTTGQPKGVMLSQANTAAAAKIGMQMLAEDLPIDDETRHLSYLPLAHVAERGLTVFGPISRGYSVYYAESIEKLADNLREVRPQFFFGVPRVWEKIQAGLAARIEQASFVQQGLVRWATGIGRQISDYRALGKNPSFTLNLADRLADHLVLGKVRRAIGLDRAVVCVSGAAPLNYDVIDFMAGFKILLQEIYGQTETGGPTSFNWPGRMKLGTVGQIFDRMEVKIAKDDEILVRGPNVFCGYYKDPETTSEALQDGWLHSGDLGRFDEGGFLHITGRRKEILITAGGKNIAPRAIEEALKTHELINEAVVIGDRRKFLSALLTLNPEAASHFARERKIDPRQLADHPDLLGVLETHLDVVNRTLSRVERIKKFRVLKRNFSVEDGELTPTLKLKRDVIYQNFAAEIEHFYAADKGQRFEVEEL